MIDFDYDQWRVLHTASLKHMFRTESSGSIVRNRKRSSSMGAVTRFFAIAFAFLMCGGFCAMLLTRATPPFGELLALSVISYFTLSLIMDRSINSLMTRETVDTIGFFPISTTTFLTSHFSSAISYGAIMCGVLAAPSFIAIVSTNGLSAGVGWLLSIASCVVFLYFAATAIFVLLLRVSSLKIFRATSTVVYVGSFFLFMWLVFLFVTSESALLSIGDLWDLEKNNLFLFFPPFWFLCLYLVFEGTLNPTTIAGSVLAFLGCTPFAYYLLSRIETQLLADLSEELATNVGKPNRTVSRITAYLRLSDRLNHETASIWLLALSHLKYDARFRSNLGSLTPVLVLFLIVIPFSEGLPSDPFIDTESAENTTSLFCIALFLIAFVIVDACRDSQQYRASWLVFMSPMRLSSYTVKVVDWAFFTLFVPILVLLTCLFTFELKSFLHALLLSMTLGWQTYAIVCLKLTFIPILPFTENLGTARKLGIYFLSLIIAMTSSFVIAQPLARWIYSDYTSCVSALLIGMIVCVTLRYVLRFRCERKFRHLEFMH